MNSGLLVDITNGVLSILSAVEAAQTLMADADSHLTLFQALFYDTAKADCNLTVFFDDLMSRYFAGHYSVPIEYPKDTVACFLAAVCLCDTDSFARFVIDLYADKNEDDTITLNDCRVLLQDLFSKSMSSSRIVEDTLQDICQYASSIADTGSVLLRQAGTISPDSAPHTDVSFPKYMVENFFTRKRKNGLWPLEVFRNQIKMKFLGLNFWNQLAKHDPLAASELLPSSFDSIRGLVDALCTVIDEVKSTNLKSSVMITHSDSDSDIFLEDGIYLSKTRKRAPKKRLSGTKLKKTLLLSVSSELEVDVAEGAVMDRFVRPEEAMSHILRHSPSSSHRSNSPGGGAFSSMQSSRAASPQLIDGHDMSESSTASPTVSGLQWQDTSTPSASPLVQPAKSDEAVSDLQLPPPPPPSSNPNQGGGSTSGSTSGSACGSGSASGGNTGNLPTLSAALASAMFHMRGLKILVVEDSLFQRKMMAKKLHSVSKNAGATDTTSGGDKDSDAGSVSSGSRAIPSNTESGDGKALAGSPLPAPFLGWGGGGGGGGSVSSGSSSDFSPCVPVHRPSGTIDMEQVTNGAWNVTEARNGEEAIRLIINSQGGFDVIFVDENLQGSGGYLLGHEVVRILRGHRSLLPSVIIIGCSSNAPKYAHAFLEAGADAVWPKPLPNDCQIMSEICKYLAWRD